MAARSLKVYVKADTKDNSDAPTIDSKSTAQQSRRSGIQLIKNAATATQNLNRKQSISTPKYTKKNAMKQVIHLIRRLIIFGATIVYVQISITACINAYYVLYGFEHDLTNPIAPYESLLVAKYAGTTTIRDSPLLVNMLNDETSPRNGTLYLHETSVESDKSFSFTDCGNIELPDRIYSDSFQRDTYASLVEGAAYNLTFLSSMELIAPIVDCSFSSIANGDETAVRFFFLVRSTTASDDVSILAMGLSVQDYRVTKQNTFGTAAVATVALINDLQAETVDHHFVLSLGYPYKQLNFRVFELLGMTSDYIWQLRSIPLDKTKEAPKFTLTSCRLGIYHTSDAYKSNLSNMLWVLSNDPLTVLTRWEWKGKPVLHDATAWVHWLHAIFALQLCIQLVILSRIIHQNFVAGKYWIGDAFGAASRTLWLRGLIVLWSWYMDDLWVLKEFCLYDANKTASVQSIFVYESIMRADLMSLYFSVAGVLGHFLRERLDPGLTIIFFNLTFNARFRIRSIWPRLVDYMIDAAEKDYSLSMSKSNDLVKAVTPLRIWSIHELTSIDSTLLAVMLFPFISSFLLVILYALLRKLYRRYHPDPLVIGSQKVTTSASVDEDTLLVKKSALTLFEIATGAALENRFGLVANYDNCLFIKGMKFASADGVYCNGFVIANKKFLVPVDELVVIWLMKLTRVRFRDVYMFEIDGFTVQQTARLVYPELLTFKDLMSLNVAILS